MELREDGLRKARGLTELARLNKLSRSQREMESISSKLICDISGVRTLLKKVMMQETKTYWKATPADTSCVLVKPNILKMCEGRRGLSDFLLHRSGESGVDWPEGPQKAGWGDQKKGGGLVAFKRHHFLLVHPVRRCLRIAASLSRHSFPSVPYFPNIVAWRQLEMSQSAKGRPVVPDYSKYFVRPLLAQFSSSLPLLPKRRYLIEVVSV